MQLLQTAADPWTARRRRATELREVYPHAAEMMDLLLALCDVQESAYQSVARSSPTASELPGYVVEYALPGVIAATLAAGPESLRTAVVNRFHEADLERMVTDWIQDASLSATDRYLARAATSPVLEAMRLRTVVGTERRPAIDARRCPHCGSLPQLSYFALSEEALVTGHRYLLCSHCEESWIYPRLCCAGCGCTDTARLPIFSDPGHFANLRIDACEECNRHLLTVELPKDTSAVPIVDELAGLPLDLFARERGFTKITPNLMGF